MGVHGGARGVQEGARECTGVQGGCTGVKGACKERGERTFFSVMPMYCCCSGTGRKELSK